jgi:hypothetical protein
VRAAAQRATVRTIFAAQRLRLLLPVDDEAEAWGLGPGRLDSHHERIERDVLAFVEHELVDP